MSKIASVVIDGAARQFDKPYSYAVDEGVALEAGMRVIVPFGKSNQKKQGLVVEIGDGDITGLKDIISVTDTQPVLNDELIKLCKWMTEQTFCTYFDAVHTILPFGLNTKIVHEFALNPDFTDLENLTEEEKKVIDFLKNKKGKAKKETVISALNLSDDKVFLSLLRNNVITQSGNAVQKLGDARQRTARISPDADLNRKLTKKQCEVIEYLNKNGDSAVKEILYYTGITPSVISTLEKYGIIETYEKTVFRIPHNFGKVENREEIVLTEKQQKAFDQISSYLNTGTVSLLYGVTGSGKTNVFLKSVDTLADSGFGTIIMVPEISLTPQTLKLFGKRYGNKVAVFHSAMSLGQRMDEWKRVNSGEANIVIGTRSAVFAPVKNLKMIIMDEEQEHTYKSEHSPRFHARNIARFRCAYNNCPLLLASATPSIESYSLAKIGKYKLSVIDERYGNASLPEVIAVDMKKEIISGNSGSISTVLADELKNTIDDGKQAIVLINRRGRNTYVSCLKCGEPLVCPDCSITLTYHSANKRLMCHYCGKSFTLNNKCPKCNSEHLRFSGAGTQKVEEELKFLFPDARILRLDADTTPARDSFSNYLTDFANGKYDILLGTQMVAKGLDFPSVTLVGVIGADKATYSEDFRSFERTFSLLTQVVGRAGRGEYSGKAVIQTDTPDSNLIKLATAQDYDAFYNEEIQARKMMSYPPFCDIVTVATASEIRNDAQTLLTEVYNKITELNKTEYSDVAIQIMGPNPASIPKINGKYRFRIIIKCKNTHRFREMLKTALTVRRKQSVSVIVDINPETII